MRERILLVAEGIVLCARIGRALQLSGYAVELATDEKRALELARDNNFEVAPGSYPWTRYSGLYFAKLTQGGER
jgi:DNA-binding response OmpR family regulator